MICRPRFACAACGKTQQDNGAQPHATVENILPEISPPANPETIKPGEPGGLPDDRTLISEGTIDPERVRGRQVLQLFGGLLEQRKFGEAYRLWSNDGRASGLSEQQFIAAYDKYAEVHSEVGARTNGGAAGSSYVDIPFRLYGKQKSGGPFNLVGTVTLRRVNDVPGSTDAQRRWHIYKSDLNARP
jgi:hypothetical protein